MNYLTWIKVAVVFWYCRQLLTRRRILGEWK